MSYLLMYYRDKIKHDKKITGNISSINHWIYEWMNEWIYILRTYKVKSYFPPATSMILTTSHLPKFEGSSPWRNGARMSSLPSSFRPCEHDSVSSHKQNITKYDEIRRSADCGSAEPNARCHFKAWTRRIRAEPLRPRAGQKATS